MSLVETNKVKVKRGNTIFRIDPDEVQKYFQMGYDVYDADGKITKRAIPKDIPSLQKAFLDHEAEIKKLKEKIAGLEEKSSRKRAVEFEPEDTEDEEEYEAEPVKTSRRRKRDRKSED